MGGQLEKIEIQLNSLSETTRWPEYNEPLDMYLSCSVAEIRVLKVSIVKGLLCRKIDKNNSQKSISCRNQMKFCASMDRSSGDV